VKNPWKVAGDQGDRGGVTKNVQLKVSEAKDLAKHTVKYRKMQTAVSLTPTVIKFLNHVPIIKEPINVAAEYAATEAKKQLAKREIMNGLTNLNRAQATLGFVEFIEVTHGDFVKSLKGLRVAMEEFEKHSMLEKKVNAEDGCALGYCSDFQNYADRFESVMRRLNDALIVSNYIKGVSQYIDDWLVEVKKKFEIKREEIKIEMLMLVMQEMGTVKGSALSMHAEAQKNKDVRVDPNMTQQSFEMDEMDRRHEKCDKAKCLWFGDRKLTYEP